MFWTNSNQGAKDENGEEKKVIEVVIYDKFKPTNEQLEDSWDINESFEQLHKDHISYDEFIKYSNQNHNHNTYNEATCEKMKEAVCMEQGIKYATTNNHTKDLMTVINESGKKQCDYLKAYKFRAIRRSFIDGGLKPIIEICNLYGIRNLNQIKGMPKIIYEPKKNNKNNKNNKNKKPVELIGLPDATFRFVMAYIRNVAKVYNLTGKGYYKASS